MSAYLKRRLELVVRAAFVSKFRRWNYVFGGGEATVAYNLAGIDKIFMIFKNNYFGI